MKHTLNRWVVAATTFAGSALTAFAVEGDTSSVTDYDGFLTSMQTQVTGALDKIWPVLAAILGIVVGFFLARVAFKYIKQFCNKG